MNPNQSTLPPELWGVIVGHSGPPALANIATLSRAFQSLAIPTLYRSIDLTLPLQTYHCCRILATSYTDFAGIVRVLRISLDHLDLSHDRQLDFRELYVRAITRMSKLEVYQSWLPNAVVPHVAYALSNIATLRDIRVCLPPRNETRREEVHVLEKLDPRFPHLHTFGILANEPRPVSPVYQAFIQRLLHNHSSQLQHLRYVSSMDVPNVLDTIIAGSETLSALRTFYVSSSFIDPSTFWRIPNIQSLNFTYDIDFSSPVPHHVLTHLQEYSGPSRCLKGILSSPRPLTILDLDPDAFALEEVIQTVQIPLDIGPLRPHWPTVVSHIEDFPKSTGPVRALTIHLLSIDFAALPQAAPLLETLESLMIYLREEPINVRAPLVIFVRY